MTNIEETGALVGHLTGEHVIVPIDVIELYIESPEKRKSVTIIETVYADSRKSLLPFIIAPRKYIIDNWLAGELHGD